ncbi:39S ribosomal protein L14, mitochondrial isoform X2 [Rissa tridactyla]|nr:39S ribosomal protein L14, mitochondrial isoform X2 [Rissa tridactyla]
MHRAQGLKRLNPEYGLLLQKGWETLGPVTESEWHAAGQIPSCKSSWETEPGLCGAFVSPAGRALAAAEAWHLLVCVMGTQEVWVPACALLVILQKTPLEVCITGACQAIQKLTRVRVVDNSALGNTPYHRPPKCIHVYNKTGVGKVGDTILLAIKGEKKKALIVGHKMPGPTMTPRFDSNNVVLIEDNGNPVGTRIKTPIPYMLRRKGEFSKVLAIARNFV